MLDVHLIYECEKELRTIFLDVFLYFIYAYIFLWYVLLPS